MKIESKTKIGNFQRTSAGISKVARFSEADRARALQVVQQCGGNLTIASRRLGISIPTLSRWRRLDASNFDLVGTS